MAAEKQISKYAFVWELASEGEPRTNQSLSVYRLTARTVDRLIVD